MGGWLGAIGAGMSAYGEVLGKKNDQEWENQKADLSYKRQVGLENLRAQNNTKAAEQKQGWAVENATTQRMWNQEDQDKQNKYKEGQVDKQNKYSLAQDKQKREQDRLDYSWKLGQAKSVGIEESKEKMIQKKATWDELVASGQLDQYSQDQRDAMQAAYVFDIKLPKGATPNKPTDEMFKIANDLVISSAPEGTDPRELQKSIQLTAWGLAQDPNRTRAKIRGGGDEDAAGASFDPASVSKLTSLAKKAQGGNKGAQEQYDNQTANLKKQLGEAKYNELMTQVNAGAGNANAPKEEPKPEGRGMFGTAKNFAQREGLKKAFEAEVNTKNMTKLAYDHAYDQWLKKQGR